jgi:hypothetical protein
MVPSLVGGGLVPDRAGQRFRILGSTTSTTTSTTARMTIHFMVRL